jgi:acyl-coenzyme A thioesterase PaaI-like protein
MPESWKTRLYRWGFNLFPAYRGSGGWVTFIAADWQEVHIRLPLSWQTRNLVGTIFGGSIYAAVDPFYMMMLMRNLGPAYTVWDKAASIRFRKPGVSTLYARFLIDEAELGAIRQELTQAASIDRVYRVELKDLDGLARAIIEKTVYIAGRNT